MGIHGADVAEEPYVYSTMDFLNSDKWHRASDLFPLNRSGGILGELRNLGTPHREEKWLRTYYDDLSVPAEFANGLEDTSYLDYDSYGGWMDDNPQGEELKELQQEVERQREEIQKLKELVLSNSDK